MSRAPVFMLLLVAAACTDKADDGNTDDSTTVEISHRYLLKIGHSTLR